MAQACKIVLLGGGGHAGVVAETARLAGRRLAGLLDDAPHPRAAGPGLPRLGPLDDREALAGCEWLVALGDIALRRRVIDALGAGAARPLVHPGATISPSASLGRGTWVGPGAVVHTGAAIAPHCIINSGAVVEHDVRIGENVHVAPAAAIGGDAFIGADTLIGLGARILPGLKIGAGCVVGAGAVITRDFGDGSCLAGVPARPIDRGGAAQ